MPNGRALLQAAHMKGFDHEPGGMECMHVGLLHASLRADIRQSSSVSQPRTDALPLSRGKPTESLCVLTQSLPQCHNGCAAPFPFGTGSITATQSNDAAPVHMIVLCDPACNRARAVHPCVFAGR